ncbi:thioesterase family protein [Parvularcula sp. ZS-1/3]|uniref:Thioesterase family protein n=1 Tax=Parvularcula mediterranea TaxID=2732508 RepID=A0A7Y3W412_9PROT|nr:thioesterase family protein [Parvularcula mediterranea]NNU15305.1 thioesterase family protein [Parvularcula mediterranea]
MKFSELMDEKHFADGVFSTDIPESWGQGRTAYGGLTAALCARAAEMAVGELPPLRSVQVAFIAPAAGSVTTEARLLRRGKSTSFVEAEVRGEKGAATRGVLVYGAGRDSTVKVDDYPMPDVQGPDGLERMEITPMHPAFLSNYEIAPCGGGMPFLGSDKGEMQWWARAQDESYWGSEVGVLAIGDLTPPAAAPLMKTFAPVSSVNWHIDFLTDDLSTEDGWYLLHTKAQSAGDGWSSQDMGVWAKDGRPIAAARQTVVVFS